MYRPQASQVATFNPDGTGRRWLSRYGTVTGLVWASTWPGGDSTMTATLQCPPAARVKAIDAGRQVAIVRGASEVWHGILDEAVPSEAGWDLAAHGAGTYGNSYQAEYSTWTADEPVSRAISRGLDWVNPGVGTGVDMSQQADSASITVTEYLNRITEPAGLGWQVGRGNILTVAAPPSTVTRLLVATAPAARTLYGVVTKLWLRYKITDDGTNPATYGTTSVSNAALAAQCGQLETFADLSDAGTQTATAAQAVGTSLLAKYRAAGYSGTFPAQPGQLLTLGGVPVDLGCERAGMVVRLVLAGGGYGGEIPPGAPVEFLAGGFEFDDGTQTASITPYQYAASDLAGLAAAWVTAHTPKTAA